MGSDNFKRSTRVRRFVTKHRSFVTWLLSIVIVVTCLVVFKRGPWEKHEPTIVAHTSPMTTEDVSTLLNLRDALTGVLASASDMVYSAAQSTRMSLLASGSSLAASMGLVTASPRVIVTLTTIPDRIHYLQDTLLSLQSQSRPPDEIVINVPLYSRRFRDEKQEHLRYTIPAWLAQQAVEVDGGHGDAAHDAGTASVHAEGQPSAGISGYGNHANLRMHRDAGPAGQASVAPTTATASTTPATTPLNTVYPEVTRMSATVVINRIRTDHGPASKFIPTLNRELRAGRWDSLVVVADDDVHYPREWLEHLLNFHDTHPEYRGSALGMRGYCNVPANLWDWRVISQIVSRADELQAPYQVDVLTANNGLLLKPYFFLRHPIDITASAPRSAYFMDDIWLNGVLAANNVTKFIVPSPAQPAHRELVQRETQTLENVPIGRAYHNNVLLKHFEQHWTNCVQRKHAQVPEYFLRYQAPNKQELNTLSNPWAHLGLADGAVTLRAYSSEELLASRAQNSPTLAALLAASRAQALPDAGGSSDTAGAGLPPPSATFPSPSPGAASALGVRSPQQPQLLATSQPDKHDSPTASPTSFVGAPRARSASPVSEREGQEQARPIAGAPHATHTTHTAHKWPTSSVGVTASARAAPANPTAKAGAKTFEELLGALERMRKQGKI